jgi:hypothetical protein
MLHSSGGALGFSAATRSILWNEIFASDPWKYRDAVHCKTMSDFTLVRPNHHPRASAFAPQ